MMPKRKGPNTPLAIANAGKKKERVTKCIILLDQVCKEWPGISPMNSDLFADVRKALEIRRTVLNEL